MYRYIAVEGPIGVGKTSVAKSLGDRLNARLILEEAEGNPFLKGFYDDARRYAFQAQLFFLLSRYRQQQMVRQSDLFHSVTISDYMFEKDRLFAGLNLTDDELLLYDRVQQFFAVRVPKPDLIVFLQADTDTLMSRIRSRGRRFEYRIERKYLENVVQAYDRYFFEYDQGPVLIVNTTDVNLALEEDAIDGLVKQLDHIRPGSQYYTPSKA